MSDIFITGHQTLSGMPEKLFWFWVVEAQEQALVVEVHFHFRYL